MQTSTMRALVFGIYFCYFVIDLVALYLLESDSKSNYNLVFYLLIGTTGMHLLFLVVGTVGNWFGLTHLYLEEEYNPYPFESKIQRNLYKLTDFLLVVAIGVALWGYYNDKNLWTLRLLVAKAILSNLMCFYKFYSLQQDNKKHVAVPTQIPTGRSSQKGFNHWSIEI